MLHIKEVNTPERLTELRQLENSNNDYLYILKYSGQFLLSDNGTEIYMNDTKTYTDVIMYMTKEAYESLDNINPNIIYMIQDTDNSYILYYNNIKLLSSSEQHTHENKTVLDLLSDSNGNLLYNNNELVTNYTTSEITAMVQSLWT